MVTHPDINPVQQGLTLVNITRKTRIFIEIVFLTQIKNKNSRTWSRKLAINTSTPLAPILSISLSSFLETKFFLGNETSFCDLLDVFLFSWCHTNTSEQQPTDKNLELSSAFACKFEGGTDERAAAKSEKLFECEGCTHFDWLAIAFTLLLIGYTSTSGK